MSIPRSDPAAKDSLVVTINNTNLTTPDNSADKQNTIVRGTIIWFAVVMPRRETSGRITGLTKTLSGDVNAPRNGMTLPMLTSSAAEATTIKASSKRN